MNNIQDGVVARRRHDLVFFSSSFHLLLIVDSGWWGLRFEVVGCCAWWVLLWDVGLGIEDEG